MRCPSCHAGLSGPAPQCPACKLTLRGLDIKFGAVPRHSYLLTDLTRRLPAHEVNELSALLRLFHRKFPQSHFSVFLMHEVPKGTITEYTFWIANRARFGRVDAIGEKNFNLLLGIDVDSRAAALVAGYALEHYLTENDLERALAGATGAFYSADYAGGIRICVDLLMNRMREIVKRLEEPPALAEAAPEKSGGL